MPWGKQGSEQSNERKERPGTPSMKASKKERKETTGEKTQEMEEGGGSREGKRKGPIPGLRFDHGSHADSLGRSTSTDHCNRTTHMVSTINNRAGSRRMPVS